MKLFLYCTLLCTLGCASFSFNRLTNQTYPVFAETDSVVTITSVDPPPSKSIVIGNFTYANFNLSGLWVNKRSEVHALARSNGANVVQILDYSIFSGKMSGTLYRIESDSSLNNYLGLLHNLKFSECQCAIVHFLRLDDGLRSVFPIKVFSNGTFVTDLPPIADYVMNITNPGTLLLSSSLDGNGLPLNIEIGKEYFIFVTKNTTSIASSGSFSVSIGPTMFSHLDPEEGMIWALLINKKLKK